MIDVSVIIPCLNEEAFIGNCLDSLINGDYPAEKFEIIVVDGMSEDRTREIVKEYAARHPFIRLVDNPRKKTVYAFNIGIRNSNDSSRYITILNSHGTYQPDRLSKSINYIQEHLVDAVGGISTAISRDNSPIGVSIAAALSSPFGVGNSFRVSTDKIQIADTASGCLYKKEVFEKLGLFNEKLIYSQDMEFNRRLTRAGGKILVVPEIITNYYARSDYISFIKHNLRNGIWVIRPFKYSKVTPVSWYHLVPLIFVSALLITLLLSPISNLFFFLFTAIIGCYLLASLYFSVKILLKKRKRSYLLLPFVFASLHLSYGFGSLWTVIHSALPSKR
jgi:glycosyltransferase involved in cell wall biosynthesis